MRVAATVLLVVLAAGCGAGRMVRRGAVNTEALTAVRRALASVRGLDFTAPVPVAALAPEEIRALLEREIETSYRPGDLETIEAVYVRLGLLAEGTALRAALQRLYEEEAAGFYDPRAKRLVLATRALHAGGRWLAILSGLTGRDLAGEFIVAHELTHALQDQHYGLPTSLEPIVDAHGDQLLARHALLEGDATLAGFATMMGRRPDAGTLGRIEREFAELPADLARRYPEVPAVLRAVLAFQYREGTSFCAWALSRGGWKAVDAVHADPPDSSEQVLHPARYYGMRDEPTSIMLAGTEGLEAAGWKRILEDTLGELLVRVLAEGSLPAPRAAAVADGWDGDRLRALSRDGRLILVWMTVWDAPADAGEFAEAMAVAVREARVEQRVDRVLLTIGDIPPGVVDQVWAHSVLAPAADTRPRRTCEPAGAADGNGRYCKGGKTFL